MLLEWQDLAMTNWYELYPKKLPSQSRRKDRNFSIEENDDLEYPRHILGIACFTNDLERATEKLNVNDRNFTGTLVSKDDTGVTLARYRIFSEIFLNIVVCYRFSGFGAIIFLLHFLMQYGPIWSFFVIFHKNGKLGCHGWDERLQHWRVDGNMVNQIVFSWFWGNHFFSCVFLFNMGAYGNFLLFLQNIENLANVVNVQRP